MIGEISGTAPGTSFESRAALYNKKVHRAHQAGIVGTERTGAESIVLSGGYVDDEDYGDLIIYTGHGGRDPNTGRQVANQDFTRWNKALIVNQLEGLPVRVIRGYEHRSPYSPAEGYRYDGLFWVDDHWKELGVDGHIVCRFRLVTEQRRTKPEIPEETGHNGPAPRKPTSIQRIVRDTATGKRVKALHRYACQVCGVRLESRAGYYAEAAHIRPLGSPHDGPDVTSNLLCLCPNHHVLFDYGSFTIADNLTLIGLPGKLRTRAGHNIDKDHLEYHRRMWAKRNTPKTKGDGGTGETAPNQQSEQA